MVKARNAVASARRLAVWAVLFVILTILSVLALLPSLHRLPKERINPSASLHNKPQPPIQARPLSPALNSPSNTSSPSSSLDVVSTPPRKPFRCTKKRFLGDDYGGWTLCEPSTLLRSQIVYTVGVGRNIEWDKAMIREFGTIHHGWDPTPTAIDFFQKKNPPDGFSFHEFGLGVRDGPVTVKLPEGNFDSYTIMGYAKKAKKGSINTIEVRTVESMMKMLHHNHLAILKMDIEGAEFDVIDEWVRSAYKVPADQVLIEFHGRYFGKNERDKLVPKAVDNMKRLGFDVFHRARLVRFTLFHFFLCSFSFLVFQLTDRVTEFVFVRHNFCQCRRFLLFDRSENHLDALTLKTFCRRISSITYLLDKCEVYAQLFTDAIKQQSMTTAILPLWLFRSSFDRMYGVKLSHVT